MWRNRRLADCAYQIFHPRWLPRERLLEFSERAKVTTVGIQADKGQCGRFPASAYEVLGGQLGAVGNDASDQDNDDLEYTHFTGLTAHTLATSVAKQPAGSNAVSAYLTTSTMCSGRTTVPGARRRRGPPAARRRASDRPRFENRCYGFRMTQ